MATVSLANLTAQLRIYLSDPTTGQVKWQDADLEQFLKDATTVWTTDLPVPSDQSVNVVAHEYDLPTDLVEAYWIRGYFASSSTLEFIQELEVEPGAWTDNYEPIGFLLDFPERGKFYLPRQPLGTTFNLYYGAVHAELSDVVDLDMGRHT